MRRSRIRWLALGLCLFSLLLWQVSIWSFTEYSYRSTAPHIRFITLGVGEFSVEYCPKGSAIPGGTWQVYASRGGLTLLAWRPSYRESFWPGDAEYISVGLPLWIPTAITALWTAWLWRPRRAPNTCCCGYNLAGLPLTSPCPECGTKTPTS
jgi:hypothetical protein